MTMHLMHPSFSTTGKQRGKKKFRNAEEARRARELSVEWERKQQEWAKMSKPATKKINVAAPTPQKMTVDTHKIPSKNEWITGAVSSKAGQQYTGTKIIGIGVMHKSNSVPIFNGDEAKDIATMRR